MATPSKWPRPLLALGYSAGFLLVTVLALARQSGVPATETLWAEDGVIFFTQSVGHAVLPTLVRAYNGYDQLVPRLAVQLTAWAPLRDVPTVVALAGATGLALVSCLVFHMSRGHVASPALRVVLVGAMVLLPLAVVEMLDNLVNLPWWVFFAAFWALLWQPQSRGGRWTAAVVCCLAAASEPLVGLLLPLAVLRVGALRHWRQNYASTGLALGLVYQAAVVLGANGEHSFSRTGFSTIPPAFFARVGLGWLTGLRGTDAVVGWSRPGAEVLGGVLLVAVLVAGLTLGDRQTRAFVVAVVVLAPLCFAVPVWLRGAGPYMQTAKSVGYAGRYAATPMLMVISVLVVLAGHLPARARRRGRAGSAAALCLVLLVPAWATDFRDANGRSQGPTWASQLPLALARCRSVPGLALVRLHIDPGRDHVVIPCTTVTAAFGGATPGGGPATSASRH